MISPSGNDAKKFLLYCICGGLGVSSDLLTYNELLKLGINYQIANVAGYLMGTGISFILNALITFKVRSDLIKKCCLFFLVAAVGYLMSAIMLSVFVELVKMSALIAKITTLPIILVIQFLLNKHITFKVN